MNAGVSVVVGIDVFLAGVEFGVAFGEQFIFESHPQHCGEHFRWVIAKREEFFRESEIGGVRMVVDEFARACRKAFLLGFEKLFDGRERALADIGAGHAADASELAHFPGSDKGDRGCRRVRSARCGGHRPPRSGEWSS